MADETVGEGVRNLPDMALPWFFFCSALQTIMTFNVKKKKKINFSGLNTSFQIGKK